MQIWSAKVETVELKKGGIAEKFGAIEKHNLNLVKNSNVFV